MNQRRSIHLTLILALTIALRLVGLVTAQTPCPTSDTIYINFQTTSSPTPNCYLPDDGAIFADRGNGQMYGWNTDNTANARDRDWVQTPDQRYDTLNHMEQNGTFFWEIALANGWYQVHLVAGDPEHLGTYHIDVEGEPIIEATTTTAQHWLSGSRVVEVADGRLTLSNNTNAIGNNKINFVQITPLLEGLGNFNTQINFQPLDTPLALGYQADIGLPFADRGNELTYGWDADNSNGTRLRETPATLDVRYQTFNHSQTFGDFIWEIDVPNGTYAVHLVAGDPTFFNDGRIYAYDVEGVTAIDEQGITTNRLRSVGMSVLTEVNDGRLTISNAAGSNRNKLQFIEVSQIGDNIATIARTSPVQGESDVAITRETIIEFSEPINPNTVTSATISAQFADTPLTALQHFSPDNRRVTLFYQADLPASARIRVTIDGNQIETADGRLLDADNDGQPGGISHIDFDTLSLTVVPNTIVCGHVFASQLATSSGSENPGTPIDTPLTDVTITVDGQEDLLNTTTDANGDFCLNPAPAGRFFVHIDGRTATNNVPSGAYYPFVGKTWTSVPGQTIDVGNIFLPQVAPGTLQPVSQVADTTITFPASVLTNNPELAGVEITVLADSLFADDGSRGGSVGIAPVPPDRLPGTLPPGLEFPLVITVQTDGATNFDMPAPICFPNLPDPGTGQPLAPGEQNFLLSFNHDTGRWEPIGPMTVTSDGQHICTNPGVGIQAPGWHGTGPDPFVPDDNTPPDDNEDGQWEETDSAIKSAIDYFGMDTNVCRRLEDGTVEGLLRFRRCVRNVAACAAQAGQNLGTLPGTSAGGPIGGFDDILDALQDEAETIIDEELGGGSINQINISLDAPQAIEAHRSSSKVVGSNSTILDQEILEVSNFFPMIVVEATVLMTASATLPRPFQVGDVSILSDLTAFGLSPLASATLVVSETLPNNQAIAIVRLIDVNDLPADLVPAFRGELAANAPAYPVHFVAEVARAEGKLFLRGQTDPFGNYALFVPRDGTLERITFYDTLTDRVATINPVPNSRRLPRFTLVPVATDLPDSDNDGLADLPEDVLGTNFNNPDSDGDGVLDGAEIAQGTDPLDGIPAATGIIASVDTPGTAVDVCAVDNVAMVADSAAGVTVFQVNNSTNPVAMAQVDTPGEAQAVACVDNFAAVADGLQGVAIVDISDPPAAQIAVQVSLPGNSQAIVAVGTIAYVGTNGGIVAAIDLPTGSLLQQLILPDRILDIVAQDGFLYAFTGRELHTIDIDSWQLLSTISVPGGVSGRIGLRIFAADDLLYTTHIAGYNTFDLTDPSQPTLITHGNTAQRGWKQIVDNGSGLGVAAVGINSGGPANVFLHDVSDPTQTDVFLTQFTTPGNAQAISLFNGLAFVADSIAGLQVINYLAYDALGVSPTISLTSNTSNNLAEEGQNLRLKATVSDDVQVRNVQFLVDGQPVFTDGNFPFAHTLTTPRLSQQSTLTIQALATDTGGNTALSEVISLTITPDATPPQVVQTSPQDTFPVVVGTDTIAAFFSEPIDPATLSPASFQLFAVGPDNQIGTADDIAVTGGSVSYDAENQAAFLTFNTPFPLDDYQARLTTDVTDLIGNPLPTPFTWTFLVRDNIFWDGGGDATSWTDPLNWSFDTLPGLDDDVFIPPGFTVTYAGTAPAIKSLRSQSDFRLNSGVLTVAGTMEVNADLTFNGGTLVNATLLLANTNTLVSSNNNNRLQNVTIEGDLQLNQSFGRLNIDNSLDLNGSITLSASSTDLIFNNSQTLETGTIHLTGSGADLVVQGDGATLTLGPNVSVRGRGGLRSSGSGLQSLVNQGLIQAEASSLAINMEVFSNTGIIAATNNASLNLTGDWQNAGVISVTNGTVNLGSSFTPADVGAIQRGANSTINLTGILQNNGTTLTLDSSTGSWVINGGRINGGTVNLTEGTVLIPSSSSNNRLDGVTLNGDILMSLAFSQLRINNGLTLNGTITATASSTDLIFEGSQSLNGGTINMVGSGEEIRVEGNGAIVTFSPTSLIQGRGTVRSNGTGLQSLINQGIIRSDVGSSLLINMEAFTNTNRLEATNNSTLSLSGNWHNDNLISLTDSSLNLGGSFTPAGLGTLQRNGATTVNLTGVLENSGATLTLDSSTGSWVINGGRINGGTVNLTEGTVLIPSSNSNNRLDGVTLNGDILMSPAFSQLRINNGLTLNGTITATASSTDLIFEGSQSLNGGTINMVGSGEEIRVEGNGAVLTFSPTSLIQGRGTLRSNGTGLQSLINQGIIRSDAGSSLLINMEAFTNTNQLEATNNSTLSLSGNWHNDNLISLTDSTLNLGGSFTPTGLGTLQRNGATTVNLTGVLENNSTSLTLDSSTGSWVINGGRINGGTVNLTEGTVLIPSSNSNNRLDGVTLNGDILMSPAFSQLRINNGLTLNGTITATASSTDLIFEGSQNLNGGTINMVGSGEEIRVEGNGAVLTFSPTSLIQGRGTLRSNGTGLQSLINQGIIRSDAGSSLLINMEAFTNTNRLEATNNSTLSLSGNWHNDNLISLTDSSLNLGGSFTPADLGTLQRNGTTTVNLTGILENSGTSLTLDSSTGSWVINGGRVNGGTVNLTEGTVLIPSSNSNNRLDGVTLNGDILMSPAFSQLRINNGLTLNGTITATASSTDLIFEGSQSLNGGTINMVGSGEEIRVEGNGAVLTFSPTSLIQGRGTVRSNGTGLQSLINQGIIRSDAGSSLLINMEAFTNTNRLEATNNSTLSLSGNWHNGNLISLTNSSLNLGGSFTPADLGTLQRNGATTVSLTGVLENSGTSLTLDSSTGSWVINGGRINGGTVNLTAGTVLIPSSNSNNRLDGVTLNGDILMSPAFSQLRINNSLSLNGIITATGSSTDIFFEGVQTLNGGTISMVGSGQELFVQGTDAVLTLSPAATVRGRGTLRSSGTGLQSLVNQGLMQADISGATLAINTEGFSNSGTVTAVNGGRLSAATTVVNDGVIDLQGAGAALAINGNYSQASSGSLEMGVAGLTAGSQYSQLTISGQATLSGTLNLSLLNGFEPDLGDNFTILTFASASGQFTTVNGLDIGNGKAFALTQNSNNVTLTVVAP